MSFVDALNTIGIFDLESINKLIMANENVKEAEAHLNIVLWNNEPNNEQQLVFQYLQRAKRSYYVTLSEIINKRI